MPVDDQMFTELEASLREGMAILRGEERASRTFTYDATAGDMLDRGGDHVCSQTGK